MASQDTQDAAGRVAAPARDGVECAEGEAVIAFGNTTATIHTVCPSCGYTPGWVVYYPNTNPSPAPKRLKLRETLQNVGEVQARHDQRAATIEPRREPHPPDPLKLRLYRDRWTTRTCGTDSRWAVMVR